MSLDRRDIALFAGALVVRLAYLLEIRSGPLLKYLFIDSAFYDEFGRRLATGEGLPGGPFFMNVLYGFWLGAIYLPFESESFESERISRAALCPGSPVTPPPG